MNKMTISVEALSKIVHDIMTFYNHNQHNGINNNYPQQNDIINSDTNIMGNDTPHN